MRDHSKHIQLSRDEAIAEMLDRLRTGAFAEVEPASCERVALGDSFGRVLAEDIYAKTDIPNVLTCCMDSVALHWDDFADLDEGEIPDTSAWVRGVDWQFANTGIAMPQGFDTAIVIEHVEVSDDEQHIKILAAPSERYAGTRQPGAKAKRGDLCLPAGLVIDADYAATISSSGYSSVLVVKKPRVSFLPTGNELVPANLPFSETHPDFYAGYGHVFESNSILTRGLVENWGGTYSLFDIVPDEYKTIKATLLEAVATSDIVVLNAGSSKGSDDWSVEVLDEIGEMVYHQVSHGPGHHSFAAIVEGTPVIGISGPPGGAFQTLGFYLYPVMCAWFGLDTSLKTVTARLKGDFGPNKFAKKAQEKKLSGEQRPPEATKSGSTFQSIRNVILENVDGVLEATPLPGHGGGKVPGYRGVYMLGSGPDDVPPKEGDMIEVEIRPQDYDLAAYFKINGYKIKGRESV